MVFVDRIKAGLKMALAAGDKRSESVKDVVKCVKFSLTFSSVLGKVKNVNP